MVTDNNIRTRAIRRVKKCANFASITLRRIPWRSRGGTGETQFGLRGNKSPNKTRNVVLALMLVLTGIGLILARGLVSARASRRKEASPLSERIRVTAELRPGIKTTVPMFYINLAADQDRAAYMEYVYSQAGNSLTRIPAINGTDRGMLRRRLAMDQVTLVEYDNASAQRVRFVTRKHFRATPGEIALVLSHLDAVYTAQQNPAIHIALVMEDDASDLLIPYWPGKLEDLEDLADAIDPEWAAIRLQWLSGRRLPVIWSNWVNELSQWSAKVGGEAALVGLHNTWRRTGRLFTNSKPPLIMPFSSGFGTVATLYSRRGMDALIKKHFAGFDFDNLQDRGDNGGTGSESARLPRWSCLRTRPCISDRSFWPTLKPHVFIATPPWFIPRTAEVETGVRGEGEQSDHVLMHLQSVARALQWMISLDEALKPGGGPNVPWNTAWRVLKLKSLTVDSKKW